MELMIDPFDCELGTSIRKNHVHFTLPNCVTSFGKHYKLVWNHLDMIILSSKYDFPKDFRRKIVLRKFHRHMLRANPLAHKGGDCSAEWCGGVAQQKRTDTNDEGLNMRQKWQRRDYKIKRKKGNIEPFICYWRTCEIFLCSDVLM